MAAALSGCDDNESFSDMLRDEEHACNWYLAQQNVETEIPADSVFTDLADVISAHPGLSREEALRLVPYYRMDEDGYVYMQVVTPGEKEPKPEQGDKVYFRFSRRNINQLAEGRDVAADGNLNNVNSAIWGNTSFVFGNTVLTSSTQWGEGMQLPLTYLGYNSEVNLVLKSYMGFTMDQSTCQAYAVNVRYFKAEY